jgi:hypothetical protein
MMNSISPLAYLQVTTLEIGHLNKGFIKLYQSTNPLNILALEDDCIQNVLSSDFLTNKNAGGGGLIKTEHASWVLYLKLADREPGDSWHAKKMAKFD